MVWAGGMEIHYAGTPPYSRAAYVVWDPLLNIYLHSDRVLPPAFWEMNVSGDDETYILQAELIAAIAAYSKRCFIRTPPGRSRLGVLSWSSTNPSGLACAFLARVLGMGKASLHVLISRSKDGPL